MEKLRLAVVCDFDGTITEKDVGHKIYTLFGDERWLEVNKRWRRGEISSKDCLIGEYSFLDATEQEVMDYVRELDIDTGFVELVKICRENDIPIAIVSDGFDLYINALLEKYGLPDVEVFCNRMKFNGRKVELSFPYYDQGCGVCGNCKRLHVQKFKDDGRKIIYIGDGLSDRYAARASDAVFAKSELKNYLMENNISFLNLDDLSRVGEWLAALLAGKVDFPTNGSETEDPCEEAALAMKDKSDQKKSDDKACVRKLKMSKRVEDMGDGRYMIYYEWVDKSIGQ